MTGSQSTRGTGEKYSWHRKQHVQRTCGRREQDPFKEMKVLHCAIYRGLWHIHKELL